MAGITENAFINLKNLRSSYWRLLTVPRNGYALVSFLPWALPASGRLRCDLRKSFATLVVVAMAVTLLNSKSKLVTSWKNPSYSGPRLHRVLVIGIANNPTVRADFEDEFARRMTRDGMEATLTGLPLEFASAPLNSSTNATWLG